MKKYMSPKMITVQLTTMHMLAGSESLGINRGGESIGNSNEILSRGSSDCDWEDE